MKDNKQTLPPPRHIAIIMDGNGRWAKERGWMRLKGHEQGASSVRHALNACLESGVEYLTLYAFSAENWQRPAPEIKGLMLLLERYLIHEIKELNENGIRFQSIGQLEKLSPKIQEQIIKTTTATAHNTKLTLTLALSYGSRDEIIVATRSLAQKVAAGKLTPEAITPELFSQHLYTAKMPDPDLFVRTSGEHRISNFLLWQLSYTELYFTDKYWPDFKKEDLLEAIRAYQQRERRFGLSEFSTKQP